MVNAPFIVLPGEWEKNLAFSEEVSLTLQDARIQGVEGFREEERFNAFT
jgi:hypothetical protein